MLKQKIEEIQKQFIWITISIDCDDDIDYQTLLMFFLETIKNVEKYISVMIYRKTKHEQAE